MPAVSVEKLKQLVDRALSDEGYAERLFEDPEKIAREHELSDDETLVVKQMNREQFQVARRDAEEEAKRLLSKEISDRDLAAVVGGSGTMALQMSTTANMIVGRSVLGATGTSYHKLTTSACDCCAWKGGITMGGGIFM
jgi:hypothetical protein